MDWWSTSLSCLLYYLDNHYNYVIGSDKTTLFVQNLNIYIFVGLKLQVCSLFCLFQVHSAFRCVVMGANARRCSQMQNEIIASKGELPLKTLNSVFLRNSVLLHYIIAVHFVHLH